MASKTRYTIWFLSKRHGWMPLKGKFKTAAEATAWLDAIGRCACWQYVVSEARPE